MSELFALAAFEIERIFGRVFAEITLARRRHKARHAVILRSGKKLSRRRFRFEAHRQQRNQPARLRVQQADLDNIEVQQVLRIVQDVRLEQFDPFFDRHLRQFGGREVGQLDAGAVNRGELLLLQHLFGNVADGDDQAAAAFVLQAGGMNVEVAAGFGAERGVARRTDVLGRMERAVIGSENLRAAEGRVKVGSGAVVLAAPGPKLGVRPDDVVIAVEQRDAVGDLFEHPLVLQHATDARSIAQLIRGHENSREVLPS